MRIRVAFVRFSTRYMPSTSRVCRYVVPIGSRSTEPTRRIGSGLSCLSSSEGRSRGDRDSDWVCVDPRAPVPAEEVRRPGLVGVIDWGDAKVGDPAIDYAWLLNGPFPDWDVDEDVRRRAQIYHRLGPWFEVEYGVRTEQTEWVRSGLAGLRSRL